MNYFTFYTFICFLLVDQSLSSIWMTQNSFGIPEDIYRELKKRTIPGHSAVFVTLTVVQHYKICEDVMKIELWPLSDADETTVTPIPLHVEKIIFANGIEESVVTLLCRGINTKANVYEHYVSYGLLSNAFFIHRRVGEHVDFVAFVLGSPTFMVQSVSQIEEFYYRIRRRIENLRTESYELVREIETNDAILPLDRTSKLHLCACILRTPLYQWKNDIFFVEQLDVSISFAQNVPVKFRSESLAHEQFPTDVLICAVTSGVYTLTYGLTRSYDDDNSLFVLAGTEDAMYVDTYVKNVVLLTAGQEEIKTNT